MGILGLTVPSTKFIFDLGKNAPKYNIQEIQSTALFKEVFDKVVIGMYKDTYLRELMNQHTDTPFLLRKHI
jgi:hypothetical protein